MKKSIICLILMAMVSQLANAQLVINIRYSGENGNARKYVEEMESSGIAAKIRSIEGCIRYDYFFPADDPEGLLLIDEWADQKALDRYHNSPVMQEAAALREKYKLGGRQIRRFYPESTQSDNKVVPSPQAQTVTGLIDMHSHMIPESYMKAVRAHGMEMDENYPIPSWNTDAHLRFMDEAGIRTSVLTMPAPQPFFGDAAESAAICRRFNEEAAALKSRHPGRFLFCAALPLPDVDAAIAEAKYALEVLGADGVKLATNSYGQYLGDEALEPLMAYLHSREAIIITHPHKPSSVNDQLISAVPLASYEYLAETTRAILNMVAHDVLVRYPDLKVVVPHCGSFLPNALPRFRGLLPVMTAQGYMKPVDVAANLSRLYYDLAGAATDDAIESLLTITEPSHILYGSDYPYVAAPALVGAKKALETRLKAHGLEPQSILAGNAARLFGMEVPKMTMQTRKMENTITPRRQGLAVMAALEAKGDQTGLETAIADALDNGLTISEAKEALSQLYAYTGFPRSLNALGTLQRVLEQRKNSGIQDDPGKDADPLPQDYDALKQGTAVQTRLTGKPFHYDFVPATDYYLKAHLFGDIFARNNLSFADREIVTVSAISSLPGCEPQLVAHVSGARNMGVTDEELRALPALLEEKVGLAEAERLRGALAKVFGGNYDPVQPVDFNLWPKGEPNSAYARYFTGNSYLAPMDGGVANVTFEPRCRNNWHIHHKQVQVLICVAGRGWYQEWGKEAMPMTPGTIIAIPAEVKHWHGAAKDSWFQHLTYHKDVQEGASNEWLEPVTDAHYDAL
jgi:AhpD family alkylhydroperoxidase